MSSALSEALDYHGIDMPTAMNNWTIVGDDTYQLIGPTVGKLPAGAYNIRPTHSGIQFARVKIESDALLVDTSTKSESTKLISEVRTFWGKADQFKENGFLHRRGYLLYGPPGTGKSCLLKVLLSDLISQDGLGFYVQDLRALTIGMAVIRKVHPDRPVIAIFEDIENFHESSLLAYLDGEDQYNHVVNVATTNYKDELPERLIARPRRFDRLIKVDPPNDTIRRYFFKKKMPNITDDQLDNWVSETEQFTFAAMGDLVASVTCLDKPFADACNSLRSMLKITRV